MTISIEKEALPQQFPNGLRVLVVDHDINLLNDIKQTCLQFHYCVSICCKVSDALNLLKEGNCCFDVILIEAQMQDMNSYELLEYVSQQTKIPVIVMSIDGSQSVVMKAIEKGACAYWNKPLNVGQFKYMWEHVVRKVLNENKQEIINGKKLEVDVKKKRVKFDEKDKTKKERKIWSDKMHQEFVSIVTKLGVDEAVPKKIYELMKVDGLTREHVASHLQKYRLNLKRQEEEKQYDQQNNQISKAMESNNLHGFNQGFEFQATHIEMPKQNQSQNAILTSTLWPNNSMAYGFNSDQQFPNNNAWNLLQHKTNMMLHHEHASSLRYATLLSTESDEARIRNPMWTQTLPLQQQHHDHQQSLFNPYQMNNNSIYNVPQQTSMVVSGTIDQKANSLDSVNQNFGGFGSNYLTNSSFNTINADQIPMTQQLPMSSLTIGASSRSSSAFSPLHEVAGLEMMESYVNDLTDKENNSSDSFHQNFGGFGSI